MPGEPQLVVLQPGLLTTVQDLGRSHDLRIKEVVDLRHCAVRKEGKEGKEGKKGKRMSLSLLVRVGTLQK